MSESKNEVIHITKYSHNRSLYNVDGKCRVNLTDIANLVKQGYDLDINLDHKKDITVEVLLSVLLNTGLNFKKEDEVLDTLYYLVDEHLKVPSTIKK